jgi:molecular chaperone DnaK (HSP70)
VKYLLYLILYFLFVTPIFSQEVVENLYVILLPKSETSSMLEAKGKIIFDLLKNGSRDLPKTTAASSQIMVFRYGLYESMNQVATETTYFSHTANIKGSELDQAKLKASFSLKSLENSAGIEKISYCDSSILLGVLKQINVYRNSDMSKRGRMFYKNIFFIKVFSSIQKEFAGKSFNTSYLSRLFSEKSIYHNSNISITQIKQESEPININIDDDFAETTWVKNYKIPQITVQPISKKIKNIGIEKVLISYYGFRDNQEELLYSEALNDSNNNINLKDKDRSFTFEGEKLIVSSSNIKFNVAIEDFDSIQIESDFLVNYQIDLDQNSLFLPLVINTATNWQTSKLISQPFKIGRLTIFAAIALLILLIYIIWKFKTLVRFFLHSIKTQMKLYSQKNFTDDYETANYKSGEVIGKTKGSYYAWEEKISSVSDSYSIEIEGGFLTFGSDLVSITIEDVIAPSGFSVNLKSDYDHLKQFSPNQPLVLELKKNKPQTFHVEFHRNDFQATLNEVQKVSFILRASSKKYNVFLRENFFFGSELGNAWVGFDPGTTGTCLAAGLLSNQIEFYKEGENSIIPSVISIKKKQSRIATSEKVESKSPLKFGDYDYNIGSIAERYLNNPDYYTFQSIKKLLGYKNHFPININGDSFRMNGKQLTHLLIKKVFEQFKKVGSPSENAAIEAKRCVVAIPNNFTASKTQDLIDAFHNISQFKELRYIYESEAVAFKYLSEYAKHNKGTATPTNENILIYDMGGATINVSLLNVKFHSGNYIVDVLGKMGYGIGGDTIDYCFIKEISAIINSLPSSQKVNPFASRESVAIWWKFVKLIKNAFVDNYAKVRAENYISHTDLEQFIKIANNGSYVLPKEEEVTKLISQQLFSKEKNEMITHNSIYLKNIIYDNIKQIVRDILEKPDSVDFTKVDTIIFSGRSSHFPGVREEVKSTVDSLTKNNAKSISFSIDEAKTAVAYGACWYGLSKGSILRSDLKTGSAFGIKYKRSGDEKDIAFDEIIPRGKHYNKTTNSIANEEPFDKSLTFDNNIASFYQVMGKNANEIFKDKNNQHKYSLIGQLVAKMKLKSVGLEIFENDRIEYFIKLNDNSIRKATGTLNDMEIKEQNAEHYTWMFDDENLNA